MIRYVGMFALVLCGCGEEPKPVVIEKRMEVKESELPIGFNTVETEVTHLRACDLFERCTFEELKLWTSYSKEAKKLFIPYAENLPMTDEEAQLAQKLKDEGHIDTMFIEYGKDGKVEVRVQPCYMDTSEGKWLKRVHNVWEEVTDPTEKQLLVDHYHKGK